MMTTFTGEILVRLKASCFESFVKTNLAKKRQISRLLSPLTDISILIEEADHQTRFFCSRPSRFFVR